MNALLGLLRGFWGYIAVAVAAVAGVLAFGAKKKSEGRKQERAKQTEKINEKVRKADEVRRAVRTDPGKRDGVRKFDRD